MFYNIQNWDCKKNNPRTDWEHLRKMWFYYMKHVSGGKIKINVDEL